MPWKLKTYTSALGWKRLYVTDGVTLEEIGVFEPDQPMDEVTIQRAKKRVDELNKPSVPELPDAPKNDLVGEGTVTLQQPEEAVRKKKKIKKSKTTE